jgi:tripartite-type tricarboxylate transporter receptor subunit TctC
MVARVMTIRLQCALALMLAALSFGVLAQSYPSKPVRIIIPTSGGGGLDVLVRNMAAQLTALWRQPVVVESRAGANTLIGTEYVARATPDGYTLLITSDATFTINPHLYPKLPYDPIRDFQPIVRLVVFDHLMVAHPSFGADTLEGLIALAKRKPGVISYASYGTGSHAHLATEILKFKAGIDLVHVPFKGQAQAQTAAMSGEVPLTWSGVAASQAAIRAGVLKAIAYGGAKRAAQLPDLATFAELGYPELDASAWFGIFAPAGTPSIAIERIYADSVKVLTEPAFREKEVNAKGYRFSGLTPEDFAAHIRRELGDRFALVRRAQVK